ncbi:uncharacterized protein PFL1_01269 [Pseudozyma flocculosa PF-1]|uniref:uncharacterized protein n=1 Tax=Pseudozyma flocculosa PF-1 TaxID=1277687 RepID=UPI0004561949|nr:uncharacterized protein PFL1_01269 [Pseudozyma flocculosa PF-1]EPQ31080.1 hypothetical protein PFL1_01269 [Pseudozyma flocculosa PF-1]
MTTHNGLLSQPSASDGPDMAQLIRTAHRHALDIATFDALEDVLQAFVITHFTRLIPQGCTPQEIGIMLPSHQETQTIVKQLATARIREHAFGKLVASLGLVLSDRPGQHLPPAAAAAAAATIDSSTMSALVAILAIESQHKPDFSHFVFDHVPLFQHIEQQKRHGPLAGDPAWEYDLNLNKNRQWKRAVDRSIADITAAFVQASNDIDWHKQVDASGDIALLAQADLFELTRILVELAPKDKQRKEPMAPLPQPQPEGADLEQPEPEPEPPKGLSVRNAIKAGSSCRARLQAACKETANAAFSQGHYDEAERLYGIVDAAANGERDASVLLNRAAALLKLERFAETIEAASVALELLTRRTDAKSRNLTWKGYLRRGKARRSLLAQRDAASPDRTELIDLARKDFEEAARIDPKDPTAQAELDALEAELGRQSTADAAAAAAASDANPPKAKEKTILESPFFRADLVTGLLADTLRAPAFPLSAIMKLLSSTSATAKTATATAAPSTQRSDEEACASEHRALVSTLTAEGRAQLEESIKHIGAVLALPHYQSAPAPPTTTTAAASAVDEREWKLLTTSMRLLMGCCAMLLDAVVRAQSDIQLVSDALRPDVKGRRDRITADRDDGASTGTKTDAGAGAEVVERLLHRVQGDALCMLQRCCSLQGKAHEADKFARPEMGAGPVWIRWSGLFGWLRG